MINNLIIIGSGGLGRELLQWVKDINRAENKWNIKGFLNDDLTGLNGYESSHGIIGRVKDWKPDESEVFACAIADPKDKQMIVNLYKGKGAKFVSIIHPTAIIGEHNRVGEGLIMYPFSRITANVAVGDFVTVLSSGIGHDVSIGDYSTISSYCLITGRVKIGKRVFVGSHATIIPDVSVGDDAYIGAGSVVISEVEAGVGVMGNPARKIKR